MFAGTWTVGLLDMVDAYGGLSVGCVWSRAKSEMKEER